MGGGSSVPTVHGYGKTEEDARTNLINQITVQYWVDEVDGSVRVMNAINESRYMVIDQLAPHSFDAWIPDLPGLGWRRRMPEGEMTRRIEAMQAHLGHKKYKK